MDRAEHPMISATSETGYPFSNNPSTCFRVSSENMVTAGNAALLTASLSVESSDALISVHVEWVDSDVDELWYASVCAHGSVSVVAVDNAESINTEEGKESMAARNVVCAMSVHTVFSRSGALTWAVAITWGWAERQRAETQSDETDDAQEDGAQATRARTTQEHERVESGNG